MFVAVMGAPPTTFSRASRSRIESAPYGCIRPSWYRRSASCGLLARVHCHLPWRDAAQQAGVPLVRARITLGNERVIKYISYRRKLFRTTLHARTEYYLAKVLECDNTRAVLDAIRILEQMDGEFAHKPPEAVNHVPPQRFQINIVSRSADTREAAQSGQVLDMPAIGEATCAAVPDK